MKTRSHSFSFQATRKYCILIKRNSNEAHNNFHFMYGKHHYKK